MKVTPSSVRRGVEYHGLLRVLTLSLLLVALSASYGLAQAMKVVKIVPPGAVNTFSYGVNKNNIVVGEFNNASGATVGFAYLGGTQFKTFSAPKSNNFTRILGINDSNVVVGDFLGTDGFYHGFIITNDGTKYSQYDVAKGSASTSVFAINKAGNFAGATGSGGPNQGFVNIGGTVTKFFGSGSDNTFALGMNSSNQVVGQYYDSSGNSHGFSRDASGTITEIVFPGALQTACTGLNDAGEITGWYEDNALTFHGFTDIGGQFLTNDFIYTAGVSSSGAYAGYYYAPGPANCNGETGTSCYGYLATPQGDTLSTVQAPNAINTSIYAVNNSNVMVGFYTDAAFTLHGLMLSGNTVTNIDDPNAQPQTTQCTGINSSGEIVGSYTLPSNLERGFLYFNGSYTDIAVPGAIHTYAYGINDSGVITGTYYDAGNVEHGFVFRNAAYTTVDVPGGTNAIVWGVNANGLMTVDWADSNGFNEASLFNGTKFTNINVPGALNTESHGVNKSGNVVFTWFDFYGNYHGAMLKNGAFYIFDDPAGITTRADGINDGNLMVGRFVLTSNGQFAGFEGTIP